MQRYRKSQNTEVQEALKCRVAESPQVQSCRKLRSTELQEVPKCRATGSSKIQSYRKPQNAELQKAPKCRVTGSAKMQSCGKPQNAELHDTPNPELRQAPTPRVVRYSVKSGFAGLVVRLDSWALWLVDFGVAV